MNAIEYVKKYGVKAARDLASRSKTSIGYLSVEHHGVNQGDLQEIVEAFELVKKHGGLDNAKYDAKYLFSNWGHSSPMELRLKHAINLVEQCNAKS